MTGILLNRLGHKAEDRWGSRLGQGRVAGWSVTQAFVTSSLNLLRRIDDNSGQLLGTGLILLDLKRIRVANLLPAIAIAPAIVWALQALGIGQ